MRIGIPREAATDQTLVAATPDTVAKLLKLGYEVCVEGGAGVRSSFFDEQYAEAGAHVVDAAQAWGSDIVVCLDVPGPEQLGVLRKGAVLITRVHPATHPELVQDFSRLGITALALDAMPRISRAQSMDVLSSMSNIAGYRAVIEAANQFGRLFTGQVTAAGKMPPAKVYVIGAGVAGLAAIGTANSMGAVVSATDVRSDVADQVESLGATFVEIPVKQDSVDGYAKEMTADQQQAALEVYRRQAAANDIVITTAQIPGKPSPLLLDEEAVAGMQPGSVIVDLGASSSGSNCALTVPGDIVSTDNGVTIVGLQDLPKRLPAQASQLFGQNVVNFLKLVTPERNGQLNLNEDDEVVRGVTVTLDGQVMWPPPAVSVSAKGGKPGEDKATETPATASADGAGAQEATTKPAWRSWWWKVALACLGILLIAFAPAEMEGHFIVFELAVVVGFYVITNVTHALHTPLMSVTNAISGIIIVGAILLAGTGNLAVTIISFVAMALASINVFGGFLVTHRMLGMFERSSEQ